MGTTISFNQRNSEVPIGALPVSVTRKNGIFGGLFILVFAMAWGGLPIFGMAQHGMPDLEQPENLLFFLFPVLAVGIVLLGLHLLIWRKTVALDSLFVTVEQRGIFGRKSWQEPKTAYRGVLSRTRRVSTKNSSYTLYLVDLLHPDDKRTVNLYTARTNRDWRAKWEAYARWLELPALEAGEDGLVARRSADLDKPVAELIAEGKVKIDRAALGEPAEGVTVESGAAGLVVTRTGPELAWWGALLFLGFPLIFVYVGFFLDDVPMGVGWLFGAMGVLFEALLLAGVVWDRISRKRLKLGPAGLTVNALGPWGETRGKTLALAEIESVGLGRREQESRAVTVQIAADRTTLTFGRHLPKATMVFLKNLILSEIARQMPAGG